MLKRILLIFGFLAVVVGLGAAIYFVFFRAPAAPPPVTVTPPGAPGALPTAGPRAPGAPLAPAAPRLPAASPIAAGGVTQIKSLVSGNIHGLTGAEDKKGLNYYDAASGKFYRLTADGRIKELASRTFFNVDNVTWSPTKDRAVLEYPDGSNIVYNFTTGKQITLPKHWEEFEFSPSGNQVVGLSLGIDPRNRWLFTSNADGTGARFVEPLGENALKVQTSWSPNDQVIAFSATGEPKGFGREQILLIGKNQENFRGLIVEGLNFEGKWSPDGSRVLHSVTSPSADMRPVLWIVNAQGEAVGTNRKNLGLNTWVDKCMFADAVTVYCAVPQNLPKGAGLERSVARNAADQFYKINLATGGKTLIAIPEFPVNAENLEISADGTTLFFQDVISGGVYSIRLK